MNKTKKSYKKRLKKMFTKEDREKRLMYLDKLAREKEDQKEWKELFDGRE